MALREKVAGRVTLLLHPGESVRQVFLAQGGLNPWLAAYFGLLMPMLVRRRIIAVTDYAIVVFEAGFNGTKPGRAIDRLPRGTRIGPVKGVWSPINLAGEKLWVHRRFHKDINAADSVFSR